MTRIFVHVRISILITPILGVRVRPNVLGHDCGLEHLSQRVRIFLFFAGVLLWPKAEATILPIFKVHRLALFTLPGLGFDGLRSDNFLVNGLILPQRWVDATLRAHTGLGGLVNSLEWVFVISLGYARCTQVKVSTNSALETRIIGHFLATETLKLVVSTVAWLKRDGVLLRLHLILTQNWIWQLTIVKQSIIGCLAVV